MGRAIHEWGLSIDLLRRRLLGRGAIPACAKTGKGKRHMKSGRGMPVERSGGKRTGKREWKAIGPVERKPTAEQILAEKTANREPTIVKMVRRLENERGAKAGREETGRKLGILHKLSLVCAITSGDESICRVSFVSWPVFHRGPELLIVLDESLRVAPFPFVCRIAQARLSR
jgi:hypothetical protein